MEDKSNIMEPLIEKVEEFGSTSFELLKLRSLEKTINVGANFISRFFAFISILMFLFIANIGIAFWLGDMLGNVWYGFFAVSGFYALLGFVLYFIAHDWIKKCIGNSLISQIFN